MDIFLKIPTFFNRYHLFYSRFYFLFIHIYPQLSTGVYFLYFQYFLKFFYLYKKFYPKSFFTYSPFIHKLSTGIFTMNSLPFPCSDFTIILPLCSAIILLHIDSPRPVPPRLLERPLSTL